MRFAYGCNSGTAQWFVGDNTNKYLCLCDLPEGCTPGTAKWFIVDNTNKGEKSVGSCPADRYT